jgi:hypothetical protein
LAIGVFFVGLADVLEQGAGIIFVVCHKILDPLVCGNNGMLWWQRDRVWRPTVMHYTLKPYASEWQVSWWSLATTAISQQKVKSTIDVDNGHSECRIDQPAGQQRKVRCSGRGRRAPDTSRRAGAVQGYRRGILTATSETARDAWSLYGNHRIVRFCAPGYQGNFVGRKSENRGEFLGLKEFRRLFDLVLIAGC